MSVLAKVARVAVLLATLASAAEPPRAVREPDLKAVFLFNFAQFVQWPATAFSANDAPLTIGILGETPVAKSLEAVIAGETVEGRRVVLRRCRNLQEAASCHILFISPASETPRALEMLRGKAVLTVGESPDFVERGGMIQFVVIQSRIRLRINNDAARKVGLLINSKLLRQADTIESTSNK